MAENYAKLAMIFDLDWKCCCHLPLFSFCVHCSSLGIRFVCCNARKGLLLISIVFGIQILTLSCNDELLLFNLMHKLFFFLVFIHWTMDQIASIPSNIYRLAIIYFLCSIVSSLLSLRSFENSWAILISLFSYFNCVLSIWFMFIFCYVFLKLVRIVILLESLCL